VAKPRYRTSKSRIFYKKRSMRWEKGWKNKLPDVFWAYRIAYKTPIGMSPYQLVYGKSCHLPVELEHRDHWAIKIWNMDMRLADINRQKQIVELEEWREKAYHSAKLYKERIKRWHDHRIKLKDSSKVTWSCSSTQRSSYSVKENCEVNGKDRTPSSTLRHCRT
jgi:hypothetical protein